MNITLKIKKYSKNIIKSMKLKLEQFILIYKPFTILYIFSNSSFIPILFLSLFPPTLY